MLHGFPEFWYGWRKQIAALAEAGFRVVAPDLRGYGKSDAPPHASAYELSILVDDVAALSQALGWTRFNLGGHDWGGIIAFSVAARHPILISRLIVLNAPHPDVFLPFAREHPSQLLRSLYVGLFQLPWLPERLLSANQFSLLRRALTSTSRRGTFNGEELEQYQAQWGQAGRLSAMLNYYRAFLQKPPKRLGRVVPPTLILWGRRDHALDVGLAQASLLQCTNGRMSSHPDASHWIQHEEPEWVNEHMIRFLTEDHELDRPEPGLMTA